MSGSEMESLLPSWSIQGSGTDKILLLVVPSIRKIIFIFNTICSFAIVISLMTD